VAITFEGVGSFVGSTGSIQPTIGAEDDLNDIHVAVIGNDGRQSAGAAPSGWTLKQTMVDTGSGSSISTRCTVYWTRSDGSTAQPTFADTGNHTEGQIATFRGCVETGDPFEAVQTSEQSSSLTTSIVIDGLTTLTDAAMVLSCHTSGDDATHSSWSNGDLASITEAIDGMTTSGSDGCVGMAYGIDTTAGTVGDTTATLSKSERHANIMLALEPLAVDNDVTLTGDPGSLVLTGAVATLLHNVTLAAVAGSLVFSGAEATLTLSDNVSLTGDPGSLVLTGAAATLVHNVTLAGDPGSLVLSGAAADLLSGASVTGDPGSLVLTGAAATLVHNVTLAGDPGSLVLSGAAADLVAATILTGDPGSLVLTGAAADLVASTILAGDPGSLVLTGAVATLTSDDNVTLAGDPGSLVLSGAAATLTASVPLVARRGGVRWLLEPDPEIRADKTDELITLIQPAISAATAPDTHATALPSIISHAVSELPPGKRTRVDRLLQETGISLDELLIILQ
jgi:hypothetical protein